MDLVAALDLEALRARLPARPLTRFAPSPTGYLHLGHVANACLVWGVARALRGRVLLRIEDHDRLRSRPAYERAIYEDLAWLGFEPDVGPVRQSDEPAAYDEAYARLAASYYTYACDCSRRDIASASTPDGAAAVHRAGAETPYSGRCRTRALPLAHGRGIRVALPTGAEHFLDARLGLMEQTPAAQCGDLLIRDRDGFWTYQFAVVVDDCRQNVDLVVRGLDLLSSTGRQILLTRMLGRAAPPVFLHHGLLVNDSGFKLSKSEGDTGVRELRAAGATPAEVIARAQQLLLASG